MSRVIRRHPDMLRFSPVEKVILNLIVEKIAEDPVVEKIILFGSRAKRTHHDESDFDLAIIGQFRESSWPARDMMIRSRLGDLNLAMLDIVAVTEGELDHKFSFRNSVREGVLLYERGNQGLGKKS